jgi:hypothetical protein
VVDAGQVIRRNETFPPDGSCAVCDGPEDCASGVCDNDGTCASTCDDGTLIGDETGMDCGGPECGKCEVDIRCDTVTDRFSGFCGLGEYQSCGTSVCFDGAAESWGGVLTCTVTDGLAQQVKAFADSVTYSCTLPVSDTSVDVLVVAGGGGAGGSVRSFLGGGGGAGYRGYGFQAGSVGIVGQGNAGGDQRYSNWAAGGGGAGVVGQDQVAAPGCGSLVGCPVKGGLGGAGRSFDISGVEREYASGGNGSIGSATDGQIGARGTGNGGNSSYDLSNGGLGGVGGIGTIVVRYPARSANCELCDESIPCDEATDGPSGFRSEALDGRGVNDRRARSRLAGRPAHAEADDDAAAAW